MLKESKPIYAVHDGDTLQAIVWDTELGRIVTCAGKLNPEKDLTIIDVETQETVKNVDLRNVLMSILPYKEWIVVQPIKDRDITYVILLKDGSYWVSGEKTITTTLNLSSATYLPFDEACNKASKLRKNGKHCDVLPVLLMIDD